MQNESPFLTPEGLDRFRVRSSTVARNWQRIVVASLALSSLLSIATTAAIIAILAIESSKFFGTHEIEILDKKTEVEITASGFFSSTSWNLDRITGDVNYGIWPLILGTFKITAIAMMLALPLGLVSAVYLSEYASPRVRSMLKPTLEILAGIPTVVLGFFALSFITPYVLTWFGDFKSNNAAAAGIAVGILCIPLVTSLAEDALRAVPASLREGAYGIGSTRLEVTWKVVVPAALSGIISSFLLALSRAIGETMVVALAAGTIANFTVDPRLPSQTMTGFIVQTIKSENVEPGELSYYSMYVVAATLFAITFTLTLIGQLIRMRFREVYE
jgi:phosphate transport system permease protein